MTVDASLRDYYAARAAEYERIYDKPERQQDLAAMRAAVPPLFTGRDVLEIACGTGWWTRLIARTSRPVNNGGTAARMAARSCWRSGLS